jgi:hypothetical protein
MIHLVRTSSDNPDFIELVKLLDADLAKRDGYKLIPNYGQYADVENSVCFEKELQ